MNTSLCMLNKYPISLMGKYMDIINVFMICNHSQTVKINAAVSMFDMVINDLFYQNLWSDCFMEIFTVCH